VPLLLAHACMPGTVRVAGADAAGCARRHRRTNRILAVWGASTPPRGWSISRCAARRCRTRACPCCAARRMHSSSLPRRLLFLRCRYEDFNGDVAAARTPCPFNAAKLYLLNQDSSPCPIHPFVLARRVRPRLLLPRSEQGKPGCGLWKRKGLASAPAAAADAHRHRHAPAARSPTATWRARPARQPASWVATPTTRIATRPRARPSCAAVRARTALR
jgi:hypothetical protein